jgi:RHS repeat-associated protein
MKLIAVFVVFVVACRADVDPPDITLASKISPVTVSPGDAWRLFDRSIDSSFTPDVNPVALELEHATSLSALKVYGPAPYRLELRGRGGERLGFDTIDLSTLDSGWHLIPSITPTPTDHVDLIFKATGATGVVPELELWAQTQQLPPAHGTVDVTAAVLPSGYVNAAATSAKDVLAPGNCATFTVPLARPPALFRGTHLVYEAHGVFRSFSLSRSVNGLNKQGGVWLAGDDTDKAIVDDIDPEALVVGDNDVELCLPSMASQQVTITNLRLVGELDSGTSLADTVSIGGDDAVATLDGDPNSASDVAIGQHVTIKFARFISADAITLTGSNLVAPSIGCVQSAAITRNIDTKLERAGEISVVALDGAARCSGLDLTFPQEVSISSIDVLGSGASERIDWPRIVITSQPEHFGGQAWVSGYVALPRPMSGAVRVEVGDQNAPSVAGDFGQLLDRRSADTNPWTIAITVHLPDATTQSRQVVLARDAGAQLEQAKKTPIPQQTTIQPDTKFGHVGHKVTVSAPTGAPSQIRLGTAVGLNIPTGALHATTDISVRHLAQSEVPPLEPGMVNVTAPKDRGYEFLPHGQQFAKSVEVLVPYEPTLIPSEMTPQDVKTFYFDPADRKWKPLERGAIDPVEHVVHSATDHFTIMIDAVLATPKSPTPLSFDPTAMSGIAAASPADMMDIIAPPEAQQSGDARLSLPIRVPAGRGAYSPSLAVAYSSASSSGWLGMGWDVAISHVDIDTRWGVPTYDTEARYTIDGAELIPTSETEGPICQSGSAGHRYRTRVEGGFFHIIRCGTDASTHFEVHDRNGTLMVYGDDPSIDPPFDPRHASLKDPADATHISRWQLTKVVDTRGNTTIYHYAVDDVAATEPAREIYPSSIAYTSGNGVTAAYTIDFQLDDGARPDATTSGRSGFKTEVRHLLRAIHVSYRGQVIRSYVFTYIHGQFKKSLLAKASVYGTGGCSPSSSAFVEPTCSTNFFDAHTFSYYSETEGFSPSTHLTMGGTDDAQKMPLTQGVSASTNGGLFANVEIAPGLGASFGGNVQTASRDELLGLYDLNGDGLADQLYLDGTGVTALYNQSIPGVDPTTHLLFAPDPARTVLGLPRLGHESSSNWSENIGVSAPIISAGGGYSNTSSSSSSRLVDIDGDGYVDYLAGASRFGRPCPDGTCFSQAPFGAANGADPFANPALQGMASTVSQRLLQADPVVHWTAPLDGVIHITATARKLNAGGVDGATVTGYVGNAPTASQVLAPMDVIGHSFWDETRPVAAGATISLVVKTGADDGIGPDGTALDSVDADLHVDYTGVSDPQRRDSTGSLLYSYDSKADFRVAGTPTLIVAPVKGTLQIHATLNKIAATAADVRYCLQAFAAPQPGQEINLDVPCSDASHNISGTSPTIGAGLVDQHIELSLPSVTNVEASTAVMLRVESDFSFDTAAITLDATPGQPFFTYSEVCIPDETAMTELCSTDPGEVASVVLPTRATSDFGPYIALVPPATQGLFVPSGGQLIFDQFDPGLSYIRVSTDRLGVTFVADCTGGGCGAAYGLPPLAVMPGDTVYIEITAPSAPVATVTGVYYGTSTTFGALVTAHVLGGPANHGHTPFAGGFHGWTSGMWNELATSFDPDQLVSDYDNFATLTVPQQQTVAQTAFAPVASFGHNASIGNMPAWVGPGSVAYVSATSLNAGHLGLVSDGGSAAGSAGLFVVGQRTSTTTSKTLDGGIHLTDATGIFSVGLGVSVGASDTDTSVDTMDLNGDGILDVYANGKLIIGALTDDPAGRRQIANWAPSTFRHRHGFDYSIKYDNIPVVPTISAAGRMLAEAAVASTDAPLGFNTTYQYGVGRSETTNDLVDVNGDGLPDQLVRQGPNLKVRLNLGSRFGALEDYGTIDPALMPDVMPIDGFQAKELDANWLGIAGIKPDTTTNPLEHETTITQVTTDSENFFFYSSSKTSTLTESHTTRSIADINGDGLPDLVVKMERLPTGAPMPFIVQYNLGSSFGPATALATPPWDVALAPDFRSELDPFHVVGPDVISSTASNVGSSNASSLSISIPFTPFTIGGSYTTTTTADSYELSLVDIDGDGRPDHVLRRATTGGTPTTYVKFNQVTGRSNLLRSVGLPLGGTYTLDYARKGNTTDMPQSRQVLSRLEIDDGIDLGVNFPSPNVVTTFDYANGTYARDEKEFFGFGMVKTSRADGMTVERDYSVDPTSYALHGLLLREVKRDAASTLLHAHDVTYQVLSALDAGLNPVTGDAGCTTDLPALLTRVSGACTPSYSVAVQDSETRSENGTTTKTHLVADAPVDHDRFGNVLASTDSGDDAVATDDTYVEVLYLNDTAHWILGRPNSVEVHAGTATGTLLRSRTGSYNTFGELTGLSVNTGSGAASSTFGYDAYGNLNHVTTPPNESSQTQTYDVTYDPDTESFPITKVDAFGYTSQATYDARFGIAVSETDSNSNQLTRTLDAFGRVQATRSPYDSASSGLGVIYWTNQVPAGVDIFEIPAKPPGSSANTPVATVVAIWTDGLGRAIEQRQTAVVHGTAGVVTIGVVGRDSLGRVVKTQNPFFTAASPYGYVTPTVTLATTTGFDSLDRAVSTLYPDGNAESVSYTIDTSPSGTELFHSHLTAANGNVRDTYTDFKGRTRAFVEHPTTATSSVTSYDYLPTGELSQITDAEGNLTTATYDLRGLRTALNNKDTGLIENHYDLMGNRIAMIDPNKRALSTQVHFVYDRNRLEVIDYPQKPDVTYVYGAPGAPNNASGRVVTISDETGSQAFEYGALGETRRVLRTVTDTTVAAPQTYQFDTHTTFDTFGRLLQTVYPDGEIVDNIYDNATRLKQVMGTGKAWSRNYVTNIEYDEFGNRTHAAFGNNDVSDWTYDPQRVRLSSLVTTLAGTTTRVQDLHYTYDGVGNLRTIDNSLPATPIDNSLPGTTSVEFTYDGVDQLLLSGGEGTVANGSSNFELTFTYSASHNIRTKKSVNAVVVGGHTTNPPATNYSSDYKYNSTRPHLPYTAGKLEVVYDANGNPTKRTISKSTLLTWDDDNRLVEVTGEVAQRDLYDASGLRVVRNGSTHTVFANNQFEFDTASTGTKHIYAGAEQVASVVNSFTSRVNPPVPEPQGTPYYVHTNHLGSTNVVTAGSVVNDAHEYFPDGAAWIDSGVSHSVDGHLFSGKPFDPDTSFYDFGQRFYDPASSLFLGADRAFIANPKANSPHSLAVETYADNTPERFVDPDGNMPGPNDVPATDNYGVPYIERQDSATPPEVQYWQKTEETTDRINIGLQAADTIFEMADPVPFLNAFAHYVSGDADGAKDRAAWDVIACAGGYAIGETLSLGFRAFGGDVARVTTAESSPFLKRYLSTSGGRWGNSATRQLNHEVATQLEREGWDIIRGGGRRSEEWIAGPGGGKKGGTWVDITAEKDGRRLRVQTVDTDPHGNPTDREMDAAKRIRAFAPNDDLRLIRKSDGSRVKF